MECHILDLDGASPLGCTFVEEAALGFDVALLRGVRSFGSYPPGIGVGSHLDVMMWGEQHHSRSGGVVIEHPILSSHGGYVPAE